MRTTALVAAAGASSRIGRPKALLAWDPDQCFLERVLRVLHSCDIDDVVVTMPPATAASPDLLRALSRVPTERERIVTENRYPAQGLSGSVRTALEHARDSDVLLVWPIDCPFADAGLVHPLVSILERGRAASVPVVDGKRGHPVAFARAAFELLEGADAIGGPRAVLQALGRDVIEVPWTDPRVAFDVDTPEDYRNLFGREP